MKSQDEYGWVIDFHVHVGDFSRLRDDIQQLLLGYGKQKEEDVASIFGSPSRLAALLRQQGIYRAALLPEEGPATNFHITNDFVREFAQEGGADVMIPFGGVNPNTGKPPADIAERAIRNGARGFKLYPADHDFDPLTPDMMKAYRAMAEAKTPLMFHTGSSAQRDSNIEYANPKLFAKLLDEIPGLVLVLCHSGLPQFGAEARWCLSTYENCYVDTGLVKVDDLLALFPDIDDFADKILFGSDWPAGGALGEVWRTYHNKLPEHVARKVLCENAARLLDIPLPRTFVTAGT